MNDKDDILFDRLAIVAAVISFAITVAILIAAGSARVGKALYIVLYVITFLAVCALYLIYKGLKWSYARYTLGFRFTVALSGLLSILTGFVSFYRSTGVTLVYFNIIQITNPIVAFFMTFIITFTSIFTTGQILYLTLKWVSSGKNMSQFYFRLTTLLSVVSAGITAFISSLDTSRLTFTYYEYGDRKKKTIGEYIDDYGLMQAINEVDIKPSTDTLIVAAMCFAGVWIIYLSILWINRARPSENNE